MPNVPNVEDRRSRLTPAQRALLAKRLRGGLAESPAAEEEDAWRITPRSEAGPAPLSFAQERLWHFAASRPGSAAYNVYYAVGFRGPLDLAALARAVRAVVERHEALWTRFPYEDGGLVAETSPDLLPSRLPLIDFSGLPAASREAEAPGTATELAAPAFELERGPLLRTALLRTNPEAHALLLAVHHIVIDGWTLALITREIAALYGAFAAGEPSPLSAAPAAPLQSADFTVWQRRRIAEGALDADLTWWRGHLAGAPPDGLALPAHPGAPLGRSTLWIAPPVVEALKALAQRERATLFVILLAGLKALLHRHTGATDVIVGTPLALRGRPEAAGIVGFLLNLLALRTDLSGDPSFAELLRRVRDTFLGAFTHREAPLEWLAQELLPDRDPGDAPWIRVMFNMPSGGAGHHEPLRAHGLEVEPLLTGEMGSEFPLTFYAREVGERIRLDLGYNSGVLAPGEPARLLAGYAALLGEAAAHPGRRLSDLDLSDRSDPSDPSDFLESQ
jgi:Condensation domain